MARGNNKRGRGGPSNTARGGSGTPRGRGGRGRGRGGRGGLNNSGYIPFDEGSSTPRGNAPPRPEYASPMRGNAPSTPTRGGMGARNRRGGKMGSYNAPLSSLLYEERPLLRPIVFVRSTLTATLFQEEEEIFEPGVEEFDDAEKSHVPTANRVNQVFHIKDEDEEDDRHGATHGVDDNVDGDEEEDLEEIDFADIGKFQEQVDAGAIAMSSQAAMETTATSAEEHPMFFVDTTPAPVDTSSTPSNEAPVHTAEGHEATADRPAPTEEQVPFFIDTTPSMIDAPTTVPSRIAQLTRELQDEDEVIVYVAPHPRSTRATPAPAPPQMTSMLTGTTKTVDAKAWASMPAPPAAAVSPPPPEAFASVPQPSTPKAGPSFSFTRSSTRQPRHAPAVTPDGRARTRIRERQKNKKRRPKGEWGALGFGAFGAMHEEELWAPDPRYAERRRGDSDLEWGTDDEDEGQGATGIAEGMEVDADLVADEGAMRRFVQSMGVEGQRHVTMDDIRDGEILKAEDEEEDERGPESESSDDDEDEEEDLAADLEAILHQEEVEMMGESDDDDEDSDDSDDVDDTPQTSFRKRLERMRAAKGKQRASAPEVADDSDDDMEMDIGWEVDDYDAMERSNADADEAFLDHVDKLLAENKHLLKGKGKKRHDKLFNNILNGSFDMEDSLDELAQADTSTERKKEKYDSLPVELQEQWEKDRAKKAANKRARQLARMQVAADPLAPKKGGKKMKKAIAAAARQMDSSYGRGDMAYSDDEDLPGTIHVIPDRVIDMNTLVMEIRRFIADIGRVSMALPPANKETRKKVHDLAEAFGLKSKSKGKGDARYTTLTRTSRTGYAVSERKIGRIVRGAGGHGGMFGSSSFGGEKGKKGKGGGAPVRVPRHREGEEVGGTAPKIGESNVGFKMLAMMGWQDGQRIGVSGGLDAPIAAIMKTTKLGLGATN
ncbi:hypothetical protein EV714DRAFT_215934 [Schizophyllum commune]